MTRQPPHHGFTILEVLLALAILGVSVAVFVQVSDQSLTSARGVKLETEAALIAESVLAELEAGTAELGNYTGEWLVEENESQVEWTYEVAIEQTTLQELLQARVIVRELRPSDSQLSTQPLTFEVIRWFQDPNYLEQIASESEGL